MNWMSIPTRPSQRRLNDAGQLARQANDRRIVRESIGEIELLLQEARFLEAVTVAEQILALNLQEESFLARGYDPQEVERTLMFAGLIEQLLTRYRQFYTGFDATYTTLIQEVQSESLDLMPANIGGYSRDYADILAVEVELRDLANQIADQRLRLTGAELDESTDWFLVFYDVLVNGPGRSGEESGLLGIFTRTRTDTQRNLLLELLETARRNQVSGFINYNGNQYDFAIDNFASLEIISGFGLAISQLGSEYRAQIAAEGDDDPRASEFDRYGLLYDVWTRAAILVQSSAARLRDFDVTQFDGLQDLATALEIVDPQLTLQRSAADQWNAYSQLVADNSSELLLPTTSRVLDETGEALEIVTEFLTGVKLSFLDSYLNPFLLSFRDRTDRIEDNLEQGVVLYSGQGEPGAEGDDQFEVGFRYPNRAVELFAQTQDEAGSLAVSIDGLVQELENAAPLELELEPLSVTYRDLVQLGERLDELISRLSERRAIADGLVAEATALVAEGDSLALQIEASLVNFAVAEAVQLWEGMRALFQQALDIQEDNDLRARSDSLIVSIGLRVREAENQLIVNEVRSRLTAAEALFDGEDYNGARIQLDEAEDLWARVNIEENLEITYLRRLVDVAITLEADRDLLDTDPLYPVLSNYLNIAQDDFVNAQARLDTGSGVNELLVRANSNLDNVTAVRPYNWEARILELRLLQIESPADFDRVFERRYDEILTRISIDPLDAWTSLEALAVIDPNFPGLQDNIVQLEIALGIRPPPVAPIDTQRAAELLSQANNLVQGGDDARILAAIELLEDALAIDPRNNDVRVTLDSLRIGRGGIGSIALSSNDQAQYLRAEGLFVQDSVAQAFAIVERLWVQGQNQLFPPLISLRRRITSRLGI